MVNNIYYIISVRPKLALSTTGIRHPPVTQPLPPVRYGLPRHTPTPAKHCLHPLPRSHGTYCVVLGPKDRLPHPALASLQPHLPPSSTAQAPLQCLAFSAFIYSPHPSRIQCPRVKIACTNRGHHHLIPGYPKPASYHPCPVRHAYEIPPAVSY